MQSLLWQEDLFARARVHDNSKKMFFISIYFYRILEKKEEDGKQVFLSL